MLSLLGLLSVNLYSITKVYIYSARHRTMTNSLAVFAMTRIVKQKHVISIMPKPTNTIGVQYKLPLRHVSGPRLSAMFKHPNPRTTPKLCE